MFKEKPEHFLSFLSNECHENEETKSMSKNVWDYVPILIFQKFI
jgi:hypothetical protein